MTKEQTYACYRLAVKYEQSKVPIDYIDGKPNYQEGFMDGFQSAQTPEMLTLNPLVQKLINAVKLSKGAFEEGWNIDWNELDRALQPFKEGE